MVDDFAFLKTVTTGTPKMTIPSPSMLHLRGGRAAISKQAYPDLAEFWADVAAAYRKAIGHLSDAGCTYLQLDDITFSYLCDPKIQATAAPTATIRRSCRAPTPTAINAALAGRPDDMRVTIHTCRGNFKSAGSPRRLRPGGRGDVLDRRRRLLHGVRQRARGRLRAAARTAAARKAKKVVLGLVTTKVGALESKDELKRRIDEAAKFVPLENLCLSPQCGFSSTHHGNALSLDEQWRKLERVVEVAHDVWG